VRIIALINQKGGVGKTTTTANLGAAMALQGKRVVMVDLDPQANLTLHFGCVLEDGKASSYRVLTSQCTFEEALVDTAIDGLRLMPTDIHLSGAELELASALGRETLLRDAIEEWCKDGQPCDYLLFDCPPSLSLLSINALTTADEAFLVVQTEFFALQGMSKLLEVIELVKKRMNPRLECTGVVACLYDSRLRLAREVLGELRRHFPDRVFSTTIGQNIKLAESPGFGKTIFEYAPESAGARDYMALAKAVIAMEAPAAEPEPPARAAQTNGLELQPARPPEASYPERVETDGTPQQQGS
jgi:chromosome partitioning protein